MPLLLLLGFPLTIAIGVKFQAPSPEAPSHVGTWLLNALTLLALLFGSYCVYRAKGIRWFVSSLVAAELWLFFAASFIAGMSVSGEIGFRRDH